MKKSEIGFDLDSIERTAEVALADDSVDNLAKDVSKVKLSHDSDDDSTDSSGTCTDIDDESTSSETSSTQSADEVDNETIDNGFNKLTHKCVETNQKTLDNSFNDDKKEDLQTKHIL